MIKNIEVKKMKRFERFEYAFVEINIFSKRNHIDYNTKNLPFLNLNLNLNTQLQGSKI